MIAQEVESVLPQLVARRWNGLQDLDYAKPHAFLVELRRRSSRRSPRCGRTAPLNWPASNALEARLAALKRSRANSAKGPT